MTEIAGKTALLTGAASGIGRGLAMALAGEGAALELADKDERGLSETISMLPDGADAVARGLDVAEKNQWNDWAADITARRGAAPDIVINNAGVTLASYAKDMADDDLAWVMNINFWGVVYGTQLFMPQMLERNSGHIVNISSVFGLFGVRSQSAYCASKFAVRGYSDSVRVELEDTGVNMTVVHPGGIQTNIVRNIRYKLQGQDAPSRDEMIAGFDQVTPTSPEGAAQTIIKGIKENDPRVLIGPDARRIDFWQRLLPARFPLMADKKGSGALG
ncbi:MAG: SDR family NAD(P)-dependent oxidoreductase [Alphaproteobacteria bacterium]